MCCGVASGGTVTGSSVAMANNLAVCNKDVSTDGNPPAEDWTGELDG